MTGARTAPGALKFAVAVISLSLLSSVGSDMRCLRVISRCLPPRWFARVGIGKLRSQACPRAEARHPTHLPFLPAQGVSIS